MLETVTQMLRLRLLLLFAVAMSSTGGHATQIAREQLEAVVRKAQVGLVVDVLAASPPQTAGIWRSVEIQAQTIRRLFGDPPGCAQAGYRYEQGMPHRRGDTTVSPLVNGSGVEFDLKTGSRVILLLGANERPSEPCRVLRIEFLKQEALIRRLRKASVNSNPP